MRSRVEPLASDGQQVPQPAQTHIHAVCKKSPHSCQGRAIASGELERTFFLLNSMLTVLKEIGSQMGKRQEAICFLDIIQVLCLYVSPYSLSQQRRAGTRNIFSSGGIWKEPIGSGGEQKAIRQKWHIWGEAGVGQPAPSVPWRRRPEAEVAEPTLSVKLGKWAIFGTYMYTRWYM